MGARNRVSVTISPAMRVALEMLAERSGVPIGTQATIVLRQALDRTITSTEGLKRIQEAAAFRSNREWHDDAGAYREVERALEAVAKAQEGV